MLDKEKLLAHVTYPTGGGGNTGGGMLYGNNFAPAGFSNNIIKQYGKKGEEQHTDNLKWF